MGRPCPPNYKKKDGEVLVVFTSQQCRIKDGFLHFPKKTRLLAIKTRIHEKEKLHQVRIIPRGSHYAVELVYEKKEVNLGLSETRAIGIDIGLNNAATIVNNAGLAPVVIKGGILKSINQFYNKQVAKYRRIKDKQGIDVETKRLQKLARDRNNKILNVIHHISRRIIEYCVDRNFGAIVIGYNGKWKQGIELGRKTNQNFVQVPFLKLINQIKYKAALIGIKVFEVDESYTSKCSFLDGELIQKNDTYLGKRIHRGLFVSAKGIVINADVNAGYNIVKKAFPNAFTADGIEGVGLHPYSLAVS